MKISVIAIFYSSAKWVTKCIDSILSQKNVEIELIAVDDGSIDDTLQILQTYNDSRLIIVHQDNKGISSARNVGMSHASGDCFFFIDGDDYLPEGALSKLANYYSDDIDWVQGGYMICDEKDDLISIKQNSFGDYKTIDEINNTFHQLEFIYTHNRLINRKYIHNYFKVGVCHEDRYWNVDVYNSLNHIVNLDETTYCYVAHPSSFSQKSRANQSYIEDAIKLYYEMDRLPSSWNTIKYTFLISTIEKNLYLWNYPRTFREKAIRHIKEFNRRIDMNISGFPRFTKIIHYLIHNNYPDCIIASISRLYMLCNRMFNRKV